MAEKHLYELLKEKQEPFVLKNYINERRCPLKRPVAQTQLQPIRRKPISQNPSFPSNLCKNPCLLPFFDSHPTKSPLFDFHSPPKTPCRNSNTVFLNVPSRTAALLLESALRIQKQSSSSLRMKNSSSGFFNSVLKRIALRKRTQKREICGKESQVSLKDMLKWDSLYRMHEFAETTENSPTTEAFSEKEGTPDLDFLCSPERSDWWMGLEEKSEGLESSTSCSSSRSEELEDMEVGEEREDEFRSCEKGFCSSPFRFLGVEGWEESGFRTPDFGSPAESPGRQKTEVEEVEKQLFPRTAGADDKSLYEAEEENEQLSPVSVLDAPFTEEEEEVDEEEEEEDDGDGDGCLHEFEHSLATVQSVKHRLLNKLRRFERLAALDPLELEKRIAQDEEDCEEEDGDNKDRSSFKKNERQVKSVVALEHENTTEFIKKVLIPLDGHDLHRQLPATVKSLVLDLAKEETEEGTIDREVPVKTVCKKIEWWKNVEYNTIDMTVELDFTKERNEWLRNPKEVQEIVIKVEYVILGSLVDELLTDLNG
ncbi:hypothetical protein AAC387_Pa05g2789 [Persea americana]